MQIKGKLSKASSKKCYWEKAFPLWCVQLASWLRLANCSHWFLETSWFFSLQSLPHDKDPQGCGARWKKVPWCGWQLQAPASFYYCDGHSVAGRTLVLNPHDVIANLQARNSNIGSILMYRCAELNTRVLLSLRMLWLWIFCMALRI